MKLDWDQNDIYRSNRGAGPLHARILCATDETVKMERWEDRPDRTTRFELSIKYLLSPGCGWKKISA